MSISIASWQEQQFYALRHAFRDLCRQKVGTFFIILAIGIAFCLPTVSYLLWKNTQSLQNQYGLQGEVTLFLQPKLSQDATEKVLATLRQHKNVQKVEYLSAQKSLDQLAEFSLTQDASWFDRSLLPEAVIVSLKEVPAKQAQLQKLSQEFAQIQGVESVQIEQEFLQKMVVLSALFVKIALFCTGLMLLSVLLIITTTIRAEVYSHKKQIEVMQLLGATKNFILRPFLFKGLLYVLGGSVLACVLSFILLQLIAQDVASITPLFHSHFQLQNLNLLEGVILIFIAGMLGYFGTGVSALRYIHRLELEKE